MWESVFGWLAAGAGLLAAVLWLLASLVKVPPYVGEARRMIIKLELTDSDPRSHIRRSQSMPLAVSGSQKHP